LQNELKVEIEFLKRFRHCGANVGPVDPVKIALPGQLTQQGDGYLLCIKDASYEVKIL
jgi:hypothetical protein